MYQNEIQLNIYSVDTKSVCERIKKADFTLGNKTSLAVRKSFSALFGEETCVCCGKNSLDVPLCKKCLEKLTQEISPPGTDSVKRCSVCGKQLISENGKCMACREEPVIKSADFVFPLFTYRLWRKELLFEWKLAEKRGLSSVFAEILYIQINVLWPGVKPIVVPVPPRPGKIREKGWDQIDELCNFLEYSYGLEVAHLLERKSVFQQKKLNRENRLEKTKNSYVLRKRRPGEPEIVYPKEVLLIDDVLTTGVTVENCAFLLKKAGCHKVSAVTLFIVD